MTQRVLVLAGCDLEKGRETEDVETVSLSINGKNYEMELCAKHREYYLGTLESNARPAGKSPITRPAANYHGVSTYAEAKKRRAESTAIRAWAAQRGLTVKPTGAIPARIKAEYENRDA